MTGATLRMALYQLLSRVIVFGALAICVHGVYASFTYSVRTEGWLAKLLLVAGATLFLGLLYRWRAPLARTVGRAAPALAALPAWQFWLGTVLLGLTARLLWWQFVPFREALLGGDPLVNLRLTRGLLEHGSYGATTTFGTWQGLYPPGLPLALLPFVAVFDTAVAVLAANLCFFLAGLWFIYRACRQLGDEAHARLAALILAGLPNLFMYASLPFKEPLLVAELAAMTYALSCACQAASRAATLRWALAAGMALGLATLTQSSLAPALAIVATVVWLGAARPSHRHLLALALIAGTVLTIAPWSARQTLLFGKFVPLTTGAGWSFYTGNNPASGGGFTPYEAFFPDLLSIDERDVSAIAFQRGMAYVKDHPQRLLELAARRQLSMTCCLDHAQADTLATAGYTGASVNFWKLLVCAAWLGLIAIALLHVGDLLRAVSAAPALAATLSLPLLSFATHSIMEGGTRHMTMYIGVWVLMAVLAVQARARRTAPAARA